MGQFILPSNQRMIPSFPIGKINKLEDDIKHIDLSGYLKLDQTTPQTITNDGMAGQSVQLMDGTYAVNAIGNSLLDGKVKVGMVTDDEISDLQVACTGTLLGNVPTNTGTATIANDAYGLPFNGGYDVTFDVYAYNTIAGVRYYSKLPSNIVAPLVDVGTIIRVTLTNPGTGFTTGEVTVTQDNDSATINITSVDGDGAITGFTLTNPGQYYYTGDAYPSGGNHDAVLYIDEVTTDAWGITLNWTAVAGAEGYRLLVTDDNAHYTNNYHIDVVTNTAYYNGPASVTAGGVILPATYKASANFDGGLRLGGDLNLRNFSINNGSPLVPNLHVGADAGANSFGNYNTFIGTDAGKNSTCIQSISFGGALQGAAGTTLIGIGSSAGNNVYHSDYSLFIGGNAGVGAHDSESMVAVGGEAGYGMYNAGGTLCFGGSAGYGAYGAYGATFIGANAGYSAYSSYNAIFIGSNAGSGAYSSPDAIFIGREAGAGTHAGNSLFFGNYAGQNATSAGNSVFIGAYAGNASTNASQSVFVGLSAGSNSSSAAESTFLGNSSGTGSRYAAKSLFVGQNAGSGATNAARSIFIGWYAGQGDTVDNLAAAQHSICLGDFAGTGGFRNSIAIGTGVTNSAINQLNIGRVLYAIGLNTSETKASTPTATGSVGIGLTTPTARLHLPAGTATAGTAPLKLTTGTLLTSAELGAMEFVDNGTTGHLYITLNVAGVLTRLQII